MESLPEQVRQLLEFDVPALMEERARLQAKVERYRGYVADAHMLANAWKAIAQREQKKPLAAQVQRGARRYTSQRVSVPIVLSALGKGTLE